MGKIKSITGELLLVYVVSVFVKTINALERSREIFPHIKKLWNPKN